MRAMRIAGVMGLMCCLAAGCQDQDKTLIARNQELQAQVNDLQAQLRQAPTPAQLQGMQAEVAQREAQIQDLQQQLRQPSPGSGPGIENIETSYDPKAGTLTVSLPGDVLFDSGRTTLKASAKVTLNKIVAALNRDYAGEAVRIEGHTDSDPIIRTRNQWLDNLELSCARASAVTRYLTKGGISPKLITTSGFGDNRPKASKARSRRVEVVVVVHSQGTKETP